MCVTNKAVTVAGVRKNVAPEDGALVALSALARAGAAVDARVAPALKQRPTFPLPRTKRH